MKSGRKIQQRCASVCVSLAKASLRNERKHEGNGIRQNRYTMEEASSQLPGWHRSLIIAHTYIYSHCVALYLRSYCLLCNLASLCLGGVARCCARWRSPLKMRSGAWRWRKFFNHKRTTSTATFSTSMPEVSGRAVKRCCWWWVLINFHYRCAHVRSARVCLIKLKCATSTAAPSSSSRRNKRLERRVRLQTLTSTNAHSQTGKSVQCARTGATWLLWC